MTSGNISEVIQQLADSPSPKELIEQLDSIDIKHRGITQNDLETLLKVITDPYSRLTLSSKNHIIKHFLFFQGKVPSTVIYSIVGSLGTQTQANTQRRLPLKLQTSLVNWLICIHAYLEQPDIIERLYGLLFNYLEFEYLRSPIAQLLILSTNAKHINETRINHLLSMFSKDPQSEPIIALAVLYQQFKPQLMLNVFPRTTRKLELPNKEYTDQLTAFRKSNGAAVSTSITELKGLDDFGKKLKKRRVGSVSVDYTTSMNVSHGQNVSTIEELANRIESLTVPKDWETVLTDDTGVSLLTTVLKDGSENKHGLDTWIKMSLEGFHKKRYNEQKKFLDMLVQYVELNRVISPALIEDFLTSEEILINHPELSPYIWFFISKLTIDDIDDLKIITDLYNGILLKMSVGWCCEYIHTIGFLIKTFYNTPNLSEDDRVKLQNIFKATLRPLPQKFKNTLQNRSLGLEVISFISLLQSIPEEHLQVQDVVLPPTLIYTLLFSDDPVIFSSVCGHLNFAKSIIKTGEGTPEILELTNLHNSYVVDVCNLSWRNKAFDIPKTSPFTFGLSSEFVNSFATTLPIFDRNSNFKSLFNIHHAPTFAGYSAKIVRGLEDADTECTTRHEGPLTTTSMNELNNDPNSRWLEMDPEDVKVEVLKDLEKMGYVGLADLLFSHLKSLLNKR